MSKVLDNLKYAESHEWVRVDGNTAVIGITDYAQESLGSIVYVDLGAVGDRVEQFGEFGAVESVKAASDLIAPVTGKIIAINEEVVDNPELVNEDAYENWLIKVELEDTGELDKLLDAAAYRELWGNVIHSAHFRRHQGNVGKNRRKRYRRIIFEIPEAVKPGGTILNPPFGVSCGRLENWPPNKPLISFCGARAYDVYTPDHPYLTSRQEFLTSYTPYQRRSRKAPCSIYLNFKHDLRVDRHGRKQRFCLRRRHRHRGSDVYGRLSREERRGVGKRDRQPQDDGSA